MSGVLNAEALRRGETQRDCPVVAFVFRARVERVIDGDTIDVVIDQGMHCRRVERLRLLGINCPETRGASRDAGIAATEWVKQWMQARWRMDAPLGTGDWPLVVQTEKDDAFGRYLAHVWCAASGEYLNGAILAAGHAVVFDG